MPAFPDMAWTEVFPVFTEEMVDEFDEQATPEERAQLEEWYGVERVLNPQAVSAEVVSVSLFWKNVRAGDPELPEPTREILQSAQELGLAKRFSPWDHYVRPLLELVPGLRRRFPAIVFRVYLAKDLGFLADELAAAGNEVHLMKSSSINFAPGGLWRFLPLGEEGKLVTVTDIDRLNELESDLTRTRTMAQAGVGAWRVPVPVDMTGDWKICYLPFMGCQFGVRGGLLDVRKLLDAFTWHARRGNVDPTVIFPNCGPLPIQAHKWPTYGFDEFFMTLAAYPRLAQHGMLTFVPTTARSQLLTLDVEYVTWGNPNSELVYFPAGICCGEPVQGVVAKPEPTAVAEFPTVGGTEAATDDGVVPPEPYLDDGAIAAGIGPEPVVAFLFLTRAEPNHPRLWEEYLTQANGRARVYAHVKERESLPDDSLLHGHLIDAHLDTGWGHVSLVRATIALLKAGLADPECSHFLLVSESCVPVRPFADLAAGLRLDPRSRIRVKPWGEVRKENILKAQRVENLPGIRKELAHFQDQWMCLGREDAVLVTEEDWTPSFEQAFAPDECYFATVMAVRGHPPRQSVVNRAITWAHWDSTARNPREFSKVPPAVVAQIAESGCFFGRKFSRDSDIGRFGLHRGMGAGLAAR